METQQTTYQPTEDLVPESIPAGELQDQCPAQANVPTGYVFTDDKDLKKFYLNFAEMLCPSITPECPEIRKLHILYTHINKTCKLLALLDNFSWTDSPLVTKACGFFMLADASSSQKEKRKLNNLLYTNSDFMTKVAALHDLMAHDLAFFSRVKNNLEKMLHIGGTEENPGQDQCENDEGK